MVVRRMNGTIYEQHQYENLLAKAESLKSVQDYNLMMGNLEDPNEGDGADGGADAEDEQRGGN